MLLHSRAGWLASIKSVLPLALPLLVIAAALFITTPTRGDFWWFDSARHAMNGVFIYDFLMQGGIWHPLQYAQDYYRHYPGINIGFYPPFFYLSSAPWFALLGVSHATAQFVVALYAFFLGLFTCLIVRLKTNWLTALATGITVMTLPETALWSRQVQLDVPVIALLVAGIYFLLLHIRNARLIPLYIAAICIGCALLTRIQAIFIALPILLFLFTWDYAQRPILKHRLAALVLAGLLASPSAGLALYFSKVNSALVGAMPGMPKLFSLQNWVWYLRELPGQMGWPVLMVAIVGSIVTMYLIYDQCKKRDFNVPLLMTVLCAASAWLFFTLVSNKAPRFDLPFVVFLFIFASLALFQWRPLATTIVICALALYGVFNALFVQTVPVLIGFQQAAETVAQITPRNSNVLISAHRDGNFIFNLRALNTRPDIGVRRADKLLVEINIVKEFGVKDAQFDEAKLIAFLQKENIASVVFQPEYLTDTVSIQNLQTLLMNPKYFTLVQNVPILGAHNPNEKSLQIFRRVQPTN